MMKSKIFIRPFQTIMLVFLFNGLCFAQEKPTDSTAYTNFKILKDAKLGNNIFKHSETYHLKGGILDKAPKISDGNYNTGEEIPVRVQHSVGVQVKGNKKVNCVVLYEDLKKGAHCVKYKLLLFNKKDELLKEMYGATIGKKLVLAFPAVDINTIELTIEDQHGVTKINEIEGYLINDNLIEK